MRMSAQAALDAVDIPTRDKLVIEHVGLVRALASRLAHRIPAQVELSELISVGVLGLIDAAGRYQPSLGVPFDAFARRRIHGAMLDALRELDWAPRSLRKMRRRVDATVAQLRHDLQREPKEPEIAAALAMSEPEYERVLDQLRSADLAVIKRASSDGRDELEVAIDPDEGPHAHLERSELRAMLAEAITELPERERQILALYYHEELTLAEIGQVIGVGESRVSQLRTQAITRLRASLGVTLKRRARTH
jgi:RNA polymerase sigma factor for flagellar operon FliA